MKVRKIIDEKNSLGVVGSCAIKVDLPVIFLVVLLPVAILPVILVFLVMLPVVFLIALPVILLELLSVAVLELFTVLHGVTSGFTLSVV